MNNFDVQRWCFKWIFFGATASPLLLSEWEAASVLYCGMTPLRTCHNTVGFVPCLWSTGEARHSWRARDPRRAGEPQPLTPFHLSFHASFLMTDTSDVSFFFFCLTGWARASWRDGFPWAWGTPRCRCKHASCPLVDVCQMAALFYPRWEQGVEESDVLMPLQCFRHFKNNSRTIWSQYVRSLAL